jgi:hypothetical protein
MVGGLCCMCARRMIQRTAVLSVLEGVWGVLAGSPLIALGCFPDGAVGCGCFF